MKLNMRDDNRGGNNRKGGYNKSGGQRGDRGNRDGGYKPRGGGGRGGGYKPSGPREMHKAICSDCKQETEVPFKPSGDRPVYCRECFQNHRPPRKY
jgi:CxxC-x17-CxxC domain-containing protein